jgi:hypothetical protein
MENIYFKCTYCKSIFPSNDEKNHTCHPNFDKDVGILFCYSCGDSSGNYTQSQLNKDDKARCKKCVNINNFHRYSQYDHIIDFDESLNESVGDLDLEQTRYLLEKCNANANCPRQKTICISPMKYVSCYNSDGSKILDINSYQPTTPLKLCIFKMSDCTLTLNDQQRIVNIAQLLIAYGATNFHDAIEYFESRYGKRICDELCPYYKLYSLFLAP